MSILFVLKVFDRVHTFGSGMIAEGLAPKNDTLIGIYSSNRLEVNIDAPTYTCIL